MSCKVRLPRAPKEEEERMSEGEDKRETATAARGRSAPGRADARGHTQAVQAAGGL